MRVLVTGATGFLGGVTCRRLAALGHSVTALGRDDAKLAALADATARTCKLDLGDASGLPAIDADAVVHCAALSSPWGKPAAFYRANVKGAQTALELARRAGAHRFVHISTPSLYFRFRDQLGVREDTLLPRPVNAYAQSKRLAEQLVLASTDLDPIVLRPRGLYGAGDAALLPRLLEAGKQRALPLLNAGAAATDLTHVDDAADAICAALDHASPLAQRVFNISGGAALNVRDVAERAARRARIKLRWRAMPTALVLALARASEAAAALSPGFPEPLITAYGVGLFAFSQTLDITAAARILGWRPRISFEEGLDLTFGSKSA